MHNDLDKIEILSVKLKGDLFCLYSYRETIGVDTFDSGKINSQRPIHDDLRRAMLALNPHLPLILKDLEPKDVPDINSDISGQGYSDKAREIIPLFRLIEVVIDPEEKCASLSGTKTLDEGTMTFTTPDIDFEGGYHFALEFRMAVDTLVDEVKQYIAGKQAPHYEQTNLFEEGGENTSDEIKPVKRGRGRPKKEKPPVDDDGGEPAVNLAARVIGEGNDNTEDLTSEPLSNFQIDPSEVVDEL
jgi:hypothetical protein